MAVAVPAGRELEGLLQFVVNMVTRHFRASPQTPLRWPSGRCFVPSKGTGM